MKNYMLLLISLFLFSCTSAGSFPQSYQATVEAGAADRLNTPVSVDINLTRGNASAPICVVSQGDQQPGQIEVLDGNRGRLWWIADVPAGSSRVYSITLGQDCADAAFSWVQAGPDATELHFNGRPQIRYEHPVYSREEMEETKKPFHQVYDPNGSRLITKGLGGLYPHHRGIYFGYNQIFIGDDIVARENRIDTWHGNRGEHQQHVGFENTIQGPVVGGHVSRIHWNDLEGEPFAEELREIRLYRQPDNQMLIEFNSNLRSLRGRVRLGGDRQHAGVQYRAAQDVAENTEATRYVRPAQWAGLPASQMVNTEEHVGLPWNAIQYPLGNRRYTVAYISDPANPANAEMSERLYGRFGEFFPFELDENRPLQVRYRFWVSANGNVTREAVENRYQDLASPPRVTLH